MITRQLLESPAPRQRIVLHVVFWIVVIVLRVYLVRISFNVYSGFTPGDAIALVTANTLLGAAFYYMVVYGIRVKAKRGHRFGAISLSIVALLAYTFADSFFERTYLLHCDTCLVALRNQQPAYLHYITAQLSTIVLKRTVSLGTPISILLLIGLPLGVKLALAAYRQSLHAQRLRTENVELQLNFLKAQIQPHFLFNTLNNIYGSIVTGNPERSAELVSRLSELLRYLLYDADRPAVPLAREINFIADLVALEKVRLNSVAITFSSEVDDPERGVTPLLLIPLVENAFKFTPDLPGATIHIAIRQSGTQLEACVTNTTGSEIAHVGGIGLLNLQKRLVLCYPGRHQFAASHENECYSATLILSL